MPASPSMKLKDRYRIVVMGAAAVGKSCIISRILYEKYISEYKATVEEFHQREYQVNGMPVDLDIVDTSGAYAFPAMRQLSISQGDAFILVYAVDNDESFEEVKQLRQQILNAKDTDCQTPIVIVGNKTDKTDEQRRVGREMAESTVSIDWNHGYVEVSAKDDVNIRAVFRELLTQAKMQMETSQAAVKLCRNLSLSLKRKKHAKLAKQNSCVIA